MTVAEVKAREAELVAAIPALDSQLRALPPVAYGTDAFEAFNTMLSGLTKMKLELAGIPAALVKARDDELFAIAKFNAEAIGQWKTALSAAVTNLVSGLKVNDKTIDEMLGERVSSIVYARGGDKMQTDPVTGIATVLEAGAVSVTINPKRVLKTTGAKKDTAEVERKRAQVKYPDGTTHSRVDFVLAHANDDDKAGNAGAFKLITNKAGKQVSAYPHVLVDSKGKFEAFCASHELTGYELI